MPPHNPLPFFFFFGCAFAFLPSASQPTCSSLGLPSRVPDGREVMNPASTTDGSVTAGGNTLIVRSYSVYIFFTRLH